MEVGVAQERSKLAFVSTFMSSEESDFLLFCIPVLYYFSRHYKAPNGVCVVFQSFSFYVR